MDHAVRFDRVTFMGGFSGANHHRLLSHISGIYFTEAATEKTRKPQIQTNFS